jgi:hypothetical protein
MRSGGRHGGHRVAKKSRLVLKLYDPLALLSEHPVDPVNPVENILVALWPLREAQFFFCIFNHFLILV